MNRDLSTLPIFSSRGEERTPLFFLQSRIILKIFTHRNSSISISPNSRFNIFFLLLFEGEIPIVNLRKQPCTSIPITRYLLDRYNAPYLLSQLIIPTKRLTVEFLSTISSFDILYIYIRRFSFFDSRGKKETTLFRAMLPPVLHFSPRGEKKKERNTYYYYYYYYSLERRSRTNYIYIYFCFLFLRILFDIGEEAHSIAGTLGRVLEWLARKGIGGIYT